jgi:hypothetical protein
VPDDAVLRVRAPLTGYASLNQNILHFNLFNTKLLEGSCADFIIPQLFSKEILLPDYLRCIDELNLLSAIRALSYFRSSQSQQQSSESRKIRGEADAISTQRP